LTGNGSFILSFNKNCGENDRVNNFGVYQMGFYFQMKKSLGILEIDD